MSMQQSDYSDSGLLKVCGSLREAADVIAKHVADHNAQHFDHPLTECMHATMLVAEVLTQVGGMASLNGSNMLSVIIDSAGEGAD